jgi:large subunit ribosomal protein L25
MEQIHLTAKRREISKGAAKRLLREARVPGILYGHDVENEALHFEALELQRILAQAGTSQLIQLQIEGAPTLRPVLPREVQRHIFTGAPIHVDLLAVSMTEKLTAQVSITLVGQPEAVARGMGMLLQGANSVEIECLPGDLIPTLEVDVSGIELNSALYVSDLRVPPGITILTDPQELVAQVVYEAAPEVEEEAFAAPAEVEVVRKGKVEEEE